MTRLTRTGHGIRLELAVHELGLLRTVLEQYVDVARDESDPAAARLFPLAYPDDAEAAGEFRRYTHEGLLEHKMSGAGAVLAALAAGSPIELERADGVRWLPVLSDVRLVLADRLGIATDDDRPTGLMADVYAWLGELQWMLVEAVDALPRPEATP
jgi:hypothetical protein